MKSMRYCGFATFGMAMALSTAVAQPAPPLDEAGAVTVNGHTAQYLIRRLPLNAFPDLPDSLVSLLEQRGCLIPQTYEAHHPENVVHASFERAGSSDWALLCSARGSVTLLVYFSAAPARLVEVVAIRETERLQAHDATGALGFNWAIDPAPPEQIHRAQSGMDRRPAMLDHDALADSVVDRRTVYRFYSKGAWSFLQVPE